MVNGSHIRPFFYKKCKNEYYYGNLKKIKIIYNFKKYNIMIIKTQNMVICNLYFFII
jgi:hypothetical protein